MDTSEKTNLTFYQKIGELLYAIAAADKVVKKQEYDTLRESVKEHWKKNDDITDDFGADAAYQIEIVFDWLDYQSLNWLDYQSLKAEECFENFKEYYRENKTLFNPKIKKLVLSTAHTVADAFSGKNKSELLLLGKLELLLKK